MMTPAEPGHAAIPRITTSILWARRAPVLHKIESPTVLESDVLFCRVVVMVVVYVPVLLLAAALCVLAWGSLWYYIIYNGGVLRAERVVRSYRVTNTQLSSALSLGQRGF